MPEPCRPRRLVLAGVLVATLSTTTSACRDAGDADPTSSAAAPPAGVETTEAPVTVIVNPTINGTDPAPGEQPSTTPTPPTVAEPAGADPTADVPAERRIVANGYLAGGARGGEVTSPCADTRTVELWFDYSDGSSTTATFTLNGDYALISTDPDGLALVTPVELSVADGTLTCRLEHL